MGHLNAVPSSGPHWCAQYVLLVSCLTSRSQIWRIMGIGAKWKYRRFPGRFGLPLVGDLPEMLAKDMTIKNDE